MAIGGFDQYYLDPACTLANLFDNLTVGSRRDEVNDILSLCLAQGPDATAELARSACCHLSFLPRNSQSIARSARSSEFVRRCRSDPRQVPLRVPSL